MIFVPSNNGVSHHPEEWTSNEDCALGAVVLCQSVVSYDQKLAGVARQYQSPSEMKHRGLIHSGSFDHWTTWYL